MEGMLMEFDKVVSTCARVSNVGLAALHGYYGFISTPILAVGALILGEYMKHGLEYQIIPMVPGTVMSLLVYLIHPSYVTFIIFVSYASFWVFMKRNLDFVLQWLLRKDSAEFKALARKTLYHKLGYQAYAQTSPPSMAPTKPPLGQFSVVRTAKDSGERLTAWPPENMWPGAPGQGEPNILVDPTVTFQTHLGFGGAFTESSADLWKKMGSANQERIIDAYFRPGVGIGYNMGRVHMNSCDFSQGDWCCTEEDNDVELKTFNIKHYKETILPMMQAGVKAAGRALTLFASPWSPPGWMKDTGTMLNGGVLKEDCAAVWAKYYVRFAEKLREAGFPLWGFTVQNEPDAANGWENCMYNAEAERDFIRDHLGPTIAASGMDLKIVAWDHNRDDLFRRAWTIQKDPEAAKYVYGYGYHWYGDVRYEWWADVMDHSCFDNVRRVHEMCPDKHLLVTEVCQELGSHMGDWEVAARYAESIIRDFNNGCEAWVDWNLILDEDGGPNHRSNMCSAPIIVNTAKDKVYFNPSYCAIGQFSRHIQPGAKRILCSANRAAIQVTAYLNPDGTIVTVIVNNTPNDFRFTLECEGRSLQHSAGKESISTIIFQREQKGSELSPQELYAMWAASQEQGGEAPEKPEPKAAAKAAAKPEAASAPKDAAEPESEGTVPEPSE